LIDGGDFLMFRAEHLALCVVAFVTLVAAMTDLRKFKVYNALTVPTLIGGLCFSFWSAGISGLSTSLLGAATGFAILIVFFALGGVGAGDVKLLTAIGAWLGPIYIFEVSLASAVAAGVYAVGLIAWRQGLGVAAVEVAMVGQSMLSPNGWKRSAITITDEAARPDRRSRLVPFAAMTCVGFFFAFAWLHSDLKDLNFPGGQARPAMNGRL
jgi:prepilin peptidase CpaA